MYLSLLFSLLCCLALPIAASVWPMPATYTTGNDVIWVDKSLTATFNCEGVQHFSTVTDPFQLSVANEILLESDTTVENIQSSCPVSNVSVHNTIPPDELGESAIVRSAVREALRYIQETEFVPWKFYTRGANFEPDSYNKTLSLSTLEITQSVCPPCSQILDPKAYFAGDESYEIHLNGSSATIVSNSTLGTLRALETFKQLFYKHSDCGQPYAPNTPVYIHDQPKWSHRALSLDIARNPYTIKSVQKVIDAMASVKMSRLHVHATDSQAWPLEVPSLPDLARKGAYQPNLIWTVRDQEVLQAYGASKGISVFFEVDMPGHTASVHFAYPDLIVAFNETDWSTFAAEPESGQFKLNSTKVTEFVNTLLNDMLPRFNQFTQLHHMGGDEFKSSVYLLEETLKTQDNQILQPLIQKFMSNVLSQVGAHGLRPMVWEDLILDWNISLQLPNSTMPGTLVQAWHNSSNIETLLEKGYNVVFGDYSHWYLDCGHGTFINPYPSGFSPEGVPYNTSGGSPTQIHDPFPDYCNPYKNWREIYVYNPIENITAELQHNIEGGEVLLWSEQTDPVDLDSKLWPRAAAAAEVLWSGIRNASMIDAASYRLGEWRERAVLDLGIGSSPVQMTWCLMEGGCQW